LIYGVPGMSNENGDKISSKHSFRIPHISSYALTVEPKTVWKTNSNRKNSSNDDVAQEHFMILVETLEANNFIHYELSNLVKKIF
jgi:oxygen-independent coproporphyrinogen-3 oxidase